MYDSARPELYHTYQCKGCFKFIADLDVQTGECSLCFTPVDKYMPGDYENFWVLQRLRLRMLDMRDTEWIKDITTLEIDYKPLWGKLPK